jgi:hypothetical protein
MPVSRGDTRLPATGVLDKAMLEAVLTRNFLDRFDWNDGPPPPVQQSHHGGK